MKDTTVKDTGKFWDRELLSWQQVFSYRNFWMFASIVMIVVFHEPYGLLPGCPFYRALRYFGYGGVDIFLFASGIGCAFSLMKDSDVLRFLKRRAQRVLPVFLGCLILWSVYRYIFHHMTVPEFIGNIFGHGTLISLDSQLNWYFGCLWICYFSAPFFFALTEAYPKPWQYLLMALILGIFAIPFNSHPSMMLWSRIPVFFLGICAMQLSRRTKALTWGNHLVLTGMMADGAAGLFWSVTARPEYLTAGGWWYPFLLITPGLCSWLSVTAAWMERHRMGFLVKLAMAGGRYTLPMSLVHVIVFALYVDLHYRGYIRGSLRDFTLAVLLSIGLSWLLQKADDALPRGRKPEKNSDR